MRPPAIDRLHTPNPDVPPFCRHLVAVAAEPTYCLDADGVWRTYLLHRSCARCPERLLRPVAA